MSSNVANKSIVILLNVMYNVNRRRENHEATRIDESQRLDAAGLG